MARHILAIDQGTTQTTALVVSDQLDILAKASVEFPQHFPKSGWVEHDPAKIWDSVLLAVRAAVAESGIDKSEIAGIGITNQRETTILWERASGAPLHNAIVWQCRRTSDICDRLRREGHEPEVRRRTGLVLDPYFSGSKLTWLFEHLPGARARAARREICFGTVDSYLVWKLTAGAVHVTDATNASRTLLFDIRTGAWDPALTTLFETPAEILPDVAACSQVVGETRGVPELPDGIPIAGMAGDQQAALFGQACFERGATKCTYGTGAFLMMNLGADPVCSENGLITTLAWKLGDALTYALEGSLFVAGAAVQWLRDSLGIIESAAEIETLARQVPDSGGVVFVPALAGLGAPHWRPEARGLIAGLSRHTTRAHVARACLEGIALQVADLIEAMQRDAGRRIDLIRVDGGAAANDLLMQRQSDLLSIPLSRPASLETTATGAAFLAGLATGVWSSQAEIGSIWREAKRFTPGGSPEEVRETRERWATALLKL